MSTVLEVLIYDKIYGKFAKQKWTKFETKSNDHKIRVITQILSDLPYDESLAVRAITKYDTNNPNFEKLTKMKKKNVMRSYDKAVRHMYSPKRIEFAVPGYYVIEADTKRLTKEDFANKAYVLNALNKAGIYTREQLFKHLSNGWYYLWTIPGCGDGAKQTILKAIDKWNGKE